MRNHLRTALVALTLVTFAACSPADETSDGSSQGAPQPSSDDRTAIPNAASHSDDKQRAAVIGRVGALPAVELQGSQAIAPRKLGGEIRLAFEVHPDEPLRVVVAGTARQLLMSVGVVGQVPTPSPVRFVVRANTPSGWQTIFSQTVDAGMSWQDHLIGAEKFPAGAREFEFATELGQGSEKLSASFGSVIFSGSTDSGAESRPNIVLMSLDTLGADYLGSQGDFTGVSPNIDAVLQRSGSFARAFSQYGSTLHSHRSLFTGHYPSHITSPFLVDRLAEQGYLTLAVTENGFVSSAYGFAQGFDWYDNGPLGKNMGSAMARRTFTESADILQRMERFAPIFMFVHTYEVHNPYTPGSHIGKQIAARLSPGDTRSYKEIPRQPTEPNDRRRLWALYVGGVHDLDEEIGAFFERLSELHSADDTLVVLTSDHGEGFFNNRVGHGGVHNEVLRVPLGFHWPGRIPARRASEPVELIDVMPTILDFAGVPAAPNLDGRSLFVQLISDDAPNAESETAFSRSRKKGDTIQSERFKLTRKGSAASVRLYDLSKDPNETTDVSVQHPAETDRLVSLMNLRVRALDEAPPPSTGVDEIDSETHQRLRDLGYLE